MSVWVLPLETPGGKMGVRLGALKEFKGDKYTPPDGITDEELSTMEISTCGLAEVPPISPDRTAPSPSHVSPSGTPGT